MKKDKISDSFDLFWASVIKSWGFGQFRVLQIDYDTMTVKLKKSIYLLTMTVKLKKLHT